MNPDEIPTAITELCKTAPWIIPKSPKQAAYLLAHFWPSIAEHFAQLLLDQNPDRDADFSAGVDWAADTIRKEA